MSSRWVAQLLPAGSQLSPEQQAEAEEELDLIARQVADEEALSLPAVRAALAAASVRAAHAVVTSVPLGTFRPAAFTLQFFARFPAHAQPPRSEPAVVRAADGVAAQQRATAAAPALRERVLEPAIPARVPGRGPMVPEAAAATTSGAGGVEELRRAARQREGGVVRAVEPPDCGEEEELPSVPSATARRAGQQAAAAGAGQRAREAAVPA